MTASTPILRAVESRLMQAIERDQVRHRRRRKAFRIGAMMAAAAVILSGTALATGVLDHRDGARPSSPRWPLSVFAHRPSARARRASGGGVSAPEGAIFAALSRADGVTNELYAWHRSPHEDCLVDVEAAREVTTACDPSWAVEAEGISWAGPVAGSSGPVNVVAMVPDGVLTVEVADGDGSRHTVDVVNNVADYSAASVTELRYTLPNGSVESDDLSRRLSQLDREGSRGQ